MSNHSINAQTEDNDPILTTRSAARLLGVAVSTAQTWIESGAIASWKTPGGHRRVRLSAVTDLLNQRLEKKPVAAGRNLSQPSALEFLPIAKPDYPIPANEAERLLAVDRTGIVDTPADPVFDRLTWLASQITDTPVALISILTARRQWFKSRIGIDVEETPRKWAFCRYAILQDEPLIVEDASTDPRFMSNPLVMDDPRIRFYAGFPLIDDDGYRLGTLCVLDHEPRKLREKEIRALKELAAIASDELKRSGKAE